MDNDSKLIMMISEWSKVIDALSVKPSDYTKPIRLYCDVDDVIHPSARSESELLEQFPNLAMADIAVAPLNKGWGDTFEMKEGKFWWDTAVIERLAALSHSPNVDLVWLSSWRENAPYVLDKLLNIKSVGYLPWQLKFADYGHFFKKVALLEDQQDSPSKFIWLDDFANAPSPGYPTVFSEENEDWDGEDENEITYTESIPADRYLNITTQKRVGLTMDHMDLIEKWVEENS